jgi:hypothetical protein
MKWSDLEEGKQRTDIFEAILDRCSGETPSRLCSDIRDCSVQNGRLSTNDVCFLRVSIVSAHLTREFTFIEDQPIPFDLFKRVLRV